MKRRVVRRLLWLLPLALAVSACLPGGTPVAITTGLQVWLDQPPDGAVLPLGVFTLRAHARDAAGAGVETITFLVSSGGPPVTVGSVTTDPALPLVTADFDWNPSAPGAYTIQAQAFDRAGYVFSVPARVCVGPAPADGACATPGPAGFKLQGLVLADLNADDDGSDPGEGPLAGVLVTLSGCDTQAVHTNPAGSDSAYPEGVFAFGVAALSGCSIQVALAGYHFESFEGSATYPITWPAEEASHTILMAPEGAGTATASPSGTATPAATTTPSATTLASVTATTLASRTPTKVGAPKATASATLPNPGAPTATPTPASLPSDTPTKTELPAATATATPKPPDTPLPTATKTTAPPTATLTPLPADTAPPAIAKVSAAPNPTFYGDACPKGQDQFTASAAVTDPSGVASVTLFYRYGVNGSTGSWQSAGMAAAGGDQYSASVQNDAAAVYKLLGGGDGYVEYYVQAQDSLGNAGQSASPVIAIQYCLG